MKAKDKLWCLINNYWTVEISISVNYDYWFKASWNNAPKKVKIDKGYIGTLPECIDQFCDDAIEEFEAYLEDAKK